MLAAATQRVHGGQEFAEVGVIICPRCIGGSILEHCKDEGCILCGWTPMTEVPIDFEEFPAHRDGRQQRRNTPRLKVAVKNGD